MAKSDQYTVRFEGKAGGVDYSGELVYIFEEDDDVLAEIIAVHTQMAEIVVQSENETIVPKP